MQVTHPVDVSHSILAATVWNYYNKQIKKTSTPAHPPTDAKQVIPLPIQRQNIHSSNTKLGTRGEKTETTLHSNRLKKPKVLWEPGRGTRLVPKEGSREKRGTREGFVSRLPSKAGTNANKHK